MSLAKTQNCPLRAKMLQIEQYPVPYRNRTSAHHREEPHFFHERFQQNMEKAQIPIQFFLPTIQIQRNAGGGRPGFHKKGRNPVSVVFAPSIVS